MKKFLVVAAIVVGLLLVFARGGGSSSGGGALLASDQILADAYASHADHIHVQGGGRVIAVLKDDREGSQHQRFVLQLDSGQTVLIVHNIDLAPRIEGLAEGDLVTFSGEYIWNAEGGLVHWTHRDPGGRHVGGSLMRGGRIYQ